MSKTIKLESGNEIIFRLTSLEGKALAMVLFSKDKSLINYLTLAELMELGSIIQGLIKELENE